MLTPFDDLLTEKVEMIMTDYKALSSEDVARANTLVKLWRPYDLCYGSLTEKVAIIESMYDRPSREEICRWLTANGWKSIVSEAWYGSDEDGDEYH